MHDELTKGKTYWLENPKYGTIKAKLELVSVNGPGKSLAFALETPIMVVAFGGAMISRALPLFRDGDRYIDIFERAEWKISDQEPARI